MYIRQVEVKFGGSRQLFFYIFRQLSENMEKSCLILQKNADNCLIFKNFKQLSGFFPKTLSTATEFYFDLPYINI